MWEINKFNPSWWLKNKHLQSCFTAMFPHKAKSPLQEEELTLPDGDFIDLVWSGPEHGPLVVLVHGLEGSAHSHYIQLLIDVFTERGKRVVAMQHRSCSGRLNRLAESYNGGELKDFAFLMTVLRKRYPSQSISVVGFSLGANILLRYLAKNLNVPIHRAVAVSTPYEVGKSSDYLSKFYQRNLLNSLKEKVIGKIELGIDMPVDVPELKMIQTLREFDSKITTKIYGFKDVDHYYEASSCRALLKKVSRPTLILHALDDPFIPPDSVPTAKELSPYVTLELSPQGGHVGFIDGGSPWRPTFWLKDRIVGFLEEDD